MQSAALPLVPRGVRRTELPRCVYEVDAAGAGSITLGLVQSSAAVKRRGPDRGSTGMAAVAAAIDVTKRRPAARHPSRGDRRAALLDLATECT